MEHTYLYEEKFFFHFAIHHKYSDLIMDQKWLIQGKFHSHT